MLAYKAHLLTRKDDGGKGNRLISQPARSYQMFNNLLFLEAGKWAIDSEPIQLVGQKY